MVHWPVCCTTEQQIVLHNNNNTPGRRPVVFKIISLVEPIPLNCTQVVAACSHWFHVFHSCLHIFFLHPGYTNTGFRLFLLILVLLNSGSFLSYTFFDHARPLHYSWYWLIHTFGADRVTSLLLLSYGCRVFSSPSAPLASCCSLWFSFSFTMSNCSTLEKAFMIFFHNDWWVNEFLSSTYLAQMFFFFYPFFLVFFSGMYSTCFIGGGVMDFVHDCSGSTKNDRLKISRTKIDRR